MQKTTQAKKKLLHKKKPEAPQQKSKAQIQREQTLADDASSDDDNQPQAATTNDNNDLEELAQLANAPNKQNKVIDAKTTFESLGLHPELCKMCEKLGYKNPTNIQRDSIPTAIQGKDLIAIAETGSGKTAAFALPVIHYLLNLNTKPAPCTALVLAPTRELASQIKDHFDALGSEIGLKSILLVGGMRTCNNKSCVLCIYFIYTCHITFTKK